MLERVDFSETTREEFYAELNKPLYRRGRGRVTREMVEDEMAIFRSGKAATGG